MHLPGDNELKRGGDWSISGFYDFGLFDTMAVKIGGCYLNNI